MNCKKCPKYNTCTSLCPAAEKYVNQDYVRRKEVLANNIGINEENITAMPWPDNTIGYKLHIAYDAEIIDKMEYDILYMYYIDGYTQQYIANYCNTTQSTISRKLEYLVKLINNM